jgi:23S rRNA (cytidine2498-2'-O)-methyltransferase
MSVASPVCRRTAEFAAFLLCNWREFDDFCFQSVNVLTPSEGTSMLRGVLATCRPGFEKECASELSERATQLGVSGYPQTKPDAGFCVYHFNEPVGESCFESFQWKSLIFARSIFCLPTPMLEVPETDRVTPILGAIKEWHKGLRFNTLLVESSDSDSGRELSAFCRSFSKPLRAALLKAGNKVEFWDESSNPEPQTRCLHVFFLDYSRVYVGVSLHRYNSPWPRGIARLRFPSDSPSRSTLKLEEAFLSFMNEDERASSLSPARRAVDLGASPGGWTYQFVKRGVRTMAVDNGPMDERLMESGLVEHLRVDGFKFVPSRPVDWMVCDMVEQPKRVAELAMNWWQNQSAKRLIFNLKLPMKKRWVEVSEIRLALDEQLKKINRPHKLMMKQLYHDREEITVYIGPHS